MTMAPTVLMKKPVKAKLQVLTTTIQMTQDLQKERMTKKQHCLMVKLTPPKNLRISYGQRQKLRFARCQPM
jgi:hypothetical protein